MATGIAPATGIVPGGRGIANGRHSKARYLLIMVRGRCYVHTHMPGMFPERHHRILSRPVF